VVFRGDRSAKCCEIAGEDVDASGIDGAQSGFASENMQGGAALRSSFGEDQRTGGEIESGEVVAAREAGLRWAPVQTASDHEMEDQPEIAVQADGNALADAAKLANVAAVCGAKRRFDRTQQKRATQAHARERLPEDAWFESIYVGSNIRKLGHGSRGRSLRS
jgi:hypothetical protein